MQPHVLSQPEKKSRCKSQAQGPLQPLLAIVSHRDLNKNTKPKGGKVTLCITHLSSFTPQGFTGTKLKIIVRFIS